MSKKFNYKKGRKGEKLAEKWLESKGFDLVETNYRNELGEIDLIMIDGEVLVFVEVKLKIGEDFGRPEEMISRGKLWQIRRVAESYLTLKPEMAEKYKKYRIDAVCVVMDDKKVERISYYENIEL